MCVPALKVTINLFVIPESELSLEKEKKTFAIPALKFDVNIINRLHL